MQLELLSLVTLAFQHVCLTLVTDSEPETLLSELLAGTEIYYIFRDKRIPAFLTNERLCYAFTVKIFNYLELFL